MIGPLALLAAETAALGQPFRTAAELGEVPEFCQYQVDFEMQSLSHGADIDEFYRLARCLAIQFEPSDGQTRADLERSIGYFRELIDHVEEAGEPPRNRVTLHAQILEAYGRFGDLDAMLAEADRLSAGNAADPGFACDMFGRLAIRLEAIDHPEAAAALTGRYQLEDCASPVPPAALRGDSALRASMALRIADTLANLGEPSFGQRGMLGEADRLYRLVVMPWRRPSYSVRVAFGAEGDAVLHLAANEAGYTFPLAAIRTRSRALSAREARELREAIVAAGLDSMTARSGLQRADGQVVVCGDGTSGVFELLTQSGHTMVYRHGCDEKSPELAALIRTTFDLLPEGFTEVEPSDLLVPGYGDAGEAARQGG